MSELHVIPRNDAVDHKSSEDCVCGPTVEAVHHSIDGRETHE